MNQRRRFLQLVGGTVLFVGCSGGSTSASDAGDDASGSPEASDDGSPSACDAGASVSGSNNDICGSNAGRFDVGTPADFPNVGLYKSTDLNSNVLIGRDAGGLYALSSLCTHQCCDMNGTISGQQVGSITTRNGKPAIVCNCHGSIFNYDGSVARGPAGVPLAAYAMSLDCDGHLYVDTTAVVNKSVRLQA